MEDPRPTTLILKLHEVSRRPRYLNRPWRRGRRRDGRAIGGCVALARLVTYCGAGATCQDVIQSEHRRGQLIKALSSCPFALSSAASDGIVRRGALGVGDDRHSSASVFSPVNEPSHDGNSSSSSFVAVWPFSGDTSLDIIMASATTDERR